MSRVMELMHMLATSLSPYIPNILNISITLVGETVVPMDSHTKQQASERVTFATVPVYHLSTSPLHHLNTSPSYHLTISRSYHRQVISRFSAACLTAQKPDMAWYGTDRTTDRSAATVRLGMMIVDSFIHECGQPPQLHDSFHLDFVRLYLAMKALLCGVHEHFYCVDHAASIETRGSTEIFHLNATEVGAPNRYSSHHQT